MYFILIADDSDYANARVKIGVSNDAESRVREHGRTGSSIGAKEPYVEKLCAVYGNAKDESVVHRHFNKYRTTTKEVFSPVEPLAAYIRWLRDQSFVWCPSEEEDEIGELEPVDAAMWLPSADRQKPPPSELLVSGGPLKLGERRQTADDYYTSKKIIDCARRLFGVIDLDPASHAYANSVVQAKRIYTIADDGLSKPWRGRVWLNPPFSKWSAWVPKILSEYERGDILEMCVLAATRTITAGHFSPLLRSLNAICIIEGRIAFWGDLATSSPDDGHVILYFGNRVIKFAECFGDIGNVFAPPSFNGART